ncbi:MAG: GNAT family N-acetyltransferase [Lachnospiraceae bacterium]|nr:GNAT family N-acetyltransferase [Lachnospiraceae bacterium]
MILETERLIIRYFEETDAEDLYAYLSDAEVVKYEPYEPFSYEEARKEAKRRAEDKNFYAVALKSGKVIGNLYFAKGEFDTWELGYVFNREYWGKGYASEAAKALLKEAFTKWNARRVIAMCNPKNEGSWKLLERIGMRREGHLRQNIYFFQNEKGEPVWQDTYEYGILKNEISEGK